MKHFVRAGLAALTLSSAALAAAQNLSIATGGTGGVYYPMGGGVAAILSKFVPGMQATAEVTGGCLLYTSPSPRDRQKSRMPSSA